MSTLLLPVLWKDAHERGVKGVVELRMSDLPLKGARVGDLFPIINRKINPTFETEDDFREVESFLLYGTRVSRDRPLDPLIPELVTSPRFVAIMRVYPKKVPTTNIRIFIKTLTNKNILLRCESSDTVGFIKSKIRDKEGISLEYQRLIYTGKQLENHLALSSYGIKNQSQVHLVRMIRGGGAPSRIFADISDDSLLTERKFSRNAPEWRMAYEGLNIEGKCENSECAAFGRMIIHPKRFQAVNLLRDEDIKCPICHSNVKPRTCGFYNCAWKFDGTQASDGFSIISQWKEANGRKYHRFNADKNYGSIEWESLLVVAKQRDGSTVVTLSPTNSARAEKCTLCWSEFGSTESGFNITVGCGHSFHCVCIDQWSGWCIRNETLPSCPVCRREMQAPGA